MEMMGARMHRILLAAAAVFGMAGGAGAATVVYDANGKITGADGVEVAGNIYSVEMAEKDICPNLFTGCDDATDFAFQTEEAAIQASLALMAQVFPGGRSDMLTIAGMGDVPQVWTPYGVGSAVWGEYVLAVIIDATPFMALFSAPIPKLFAPQNMTDEAWVQWRLVGPVTPVPLPATLPLLGFALFGLGFLRSRCRPVSTHQR